MQKEETRIENRMTRFGLKEDEVIILSEEGKIIDILQNKAAEFSKLSGKIAIFLELGLGKAK